nr:hypothetical protein [uncultured Blautia sp.]
MFWKIADELYALSREVLKETKHNIHFEVNERSIHVWIEENGRGNRAGFDGVYDIYKKETLTEMSLEDYEVAKKHLERLLKEHT